jgi:hypothetical protein
VQLVLLSAKRRNAPKEILERIEMPRKGKVPKRDVLPDPKYHSKLIAKFVNCVMWEGKKSTAEGAFYDALELMAKRTGEDPLKLFERAVDNVKPVLEVRSRRVGGSTYQVPVEIRPEQAGIGHTVAHSVRPFARGEEHEGKTRRGATGRGVQQGQLGQEKRRYA